MPEEWKIAQMPKIRSAVRKGYSDDDIPKILAANTLAGWSKRKRSAGKKLPAQ